MFHYLDNAATTQTRPEAAQAAVTAMSGLRPGLCGGGIVQIVKHGSDFPLTIKYFS